MKEVFLRNCLLQHFWKKFQTLFIQVTKVSWASEVGQNSTRVRENVRENDFN